MGWRKLVLVLKEVGSIGGSRRMLPPAMTSQNSNFCSYNDVLQGGRELVRPRDVNGAEKAGLLKSGPVTSLGGAQLRDGGGRDFVGLKEEYVL